MGLTISDSDLLVIKVEDGVPVQAPMTYSNFRMIHPGDTFPDRPDNAVLAPYGFTTFKYVEQPHPAPFERIEEGTIVWDDAQQALVNTWVTVPFTDEEMAQVRVQAMRAVRARRNMLLAMSDWTQLIDAPLSADESAEWRLYRRELRDYMPSVTDPMNPPPFPTPPGALPVPLS